VIYEKNNELIVSTNNYFIYKEEIWECYPKSFRLLREKYYKINHEIKQSKKDKKRDYVYNKNTKQELIRILDLIAAPEEYLINNNYNKYERNSHL